MTQFLPRIFTIIGPHAGSIQMRSETVIDHGWKPWLWPAPQIGAKNPGPLGARASRALNATIATAVLFNFDCGNSEGRRAGRARSQERQVARPEAVGLKVLILALL